MNLLMVILSISFLIFIHESGHLILAKILKVPVETFSVGFGPFLFKFKRRETTYGLAPLLLGGYVKPRGIDPREEKILAEEKKLSFKIQPFWKRILVVSGGIAANIILGVFLYTIVFMSTPFNPTTTIAQVHPGSPAAKAGFKNQDKIVKVEGKAVKNWGEVTRIIRGKLHQKVEFKVVRQGKVLTLKPQISTFPLELKKNLQGKIKDWGYLGISSRLEKDNFLTAFYRSFLQVGQIVNGTFQGLYLTIQGKLPWRPVSPIGMVQISHQALEKGMGEFLAITAFFSIILGVINFLPLLPLDGGRALLWTIERFKKSVVNEKIVTFAQAIGVFLILLLFLNALFLDLFQPLPPLIK